MAIKKTPIMFDREIFAEISYRTGVNPNVIEIVMGTFYQIVKECIENQVGVNFGSLGRMLCAVRKPRDNFSFPNFGKGEKVIDVKGYIAPHFKINRSWKQELQEKTGFFEFEEEYEEEEKED